MKPEKILALEQKLWKLQRVARTAKDQRKNKEQLAIMENALVSFKVPARDRILNAET